MKSCKALHGTFLDMNFSRDDVIGSGDNFPEARGNPETYEKTDTLELSVSKALNDSTEFHPDFKETLSVLHNFDKQLKSVNFVLV